MATSLCRLGGLLGQAKGGGKELSTFLVKLLSEGSDLTMLDVHVGGENRENFADSGEIMQSRSK